MSRGGFRGGRGGGRGGIPGVGFGHGQISMTEWQEGVKRLKDQANDNILYPPLDNNSIAYLSRPTEQEAAIMSQTISLYNILSTGHIPPGEQMTPVVQQPGQIPPWRLTGERKTVGIEIESYSDRFNPPSLFSGPTKLDPMALRMDQSMFPPALWRAYFDGSKEKPKNSKKRRKLDDIGGDDENVEEESEISEEEDFDFDDDESDHQDYDANYFDNGEGDDDEGGDDEGGDAYED
nr:hypothetical protein L203_03705 [Cryptococcus depauperatus CBS 7841]